MVRHAHHRCHSKFAAVRRIRFIHAGGLLRLRHVLHLQAARLDMLILPSNSCEGRLHDTIAARNARPKGNIGRVFIRIKIHRAGLNPPRGSCYSAVTVNNVLEGR